MSWVATAVVGSAVVGGIMSSKSAKKQAKSADRATDASSEATAAQLAFEQERYDDWNAVYGPLQENLANYYQNVTPDYYAAVGLEQFQKEYQTGLTRLNENLAQRGIDPSSGIQASLESQAELSAAETRASIRRDAPQQAAEDKSRFLQIGLGQNPASSVSGALSQSANMRQQNALIQGQNAQNADAAAGAAWGQVIPSIGRAIDAYQKPSTLAGGPAIDYSTGLV